MGVLTKDGGAFRKPIPGPLPKSLARVLLIPIGPNMLAHRLSLVVLVVYLLSTAVSAYVELSLNAKLNATLAERKDNLRRSSDNPLGGGISIAYYYVLLQIGNQTFRVNIVRMKPLKALVFSAYC